MDAHFFRKLAKELLILEGARVEKIHAPAHDILSMQLFLPEPGVMRQRKWRLIMRFGRKDPLLFLSRAAIPNPPVPPAWIMRLRKYVQDRKLGKPVVNWVERALALPFVPPQDILDSEKNPPRWLLLDLKTGPGLLRELPENFAAAPQWPAPERLKALLKTPVPAHADTGANPERMRPEQMNSEYAGSIRTQPEPWRDYPVLTPALRKSLAHLDLPDAQALLIDLEDGEGDIFAYAEAADAPAPGATERVPGKCIPGKCMPERRLEGCPEKHSEKHIVELSAWPLEESAGQHEGAERAGSAGEAGRKKRRLEAVPPALLDESRPVLAAARLFGEPLVLADFGSRLAQGQVSPLKTEQKRLKKLLKKLEDEEERLLKMREERGKALLIQANLYRYDKEAKLTHIVLEETGQGADSDVSGPHTSGPGTFGPDTSGHAKIKNTLKIDLDPKLSLLRNMEAFFKRSERGERGLRFLEERRALVRRELEAGKEGLENIPAHTPAADAAPGKGKIDSGLPADKTSSKTRQPEQNRLYSVFKSSDGYSMLLGKSAKGNHELMRLALPHDYWLHSELGQSAHLIIRRKHAADAVPERTLQEAGILVGLKSWQSADARANIICSLGKDIKPLKGAAQGTAKINKVLRSFTVDLDLGLPQKLSAE